MKYVLSPSNKKRFNTPLLAWIALALLLVVVMMKITNNRSEKKYNKLKENYTENIKQNDSAMIAQKATSVAAYNEMQEDRENRVMQAIKDSLKIVKLENMNAKQQSAIFRLRNGEIQGDTFICLDSNQVRYLNLFAAKCDSVQNQLNEADKIIVGALEAIYSLQIENEICYTGIEIRNDFLKQQDEFIRKEMKKNQKLRKRGRVKNFIFGLGGLIGGFNVGRLIK